MPTPGIRTTMTLDGEKEYKSALSEINSALKVLNSEMKLTKEQFSDQADSVEALTAEHDVLERQYLTQKEKVEHLRAALQQVGETYGEASNKTNSYKVSLNNAETELLKLDRALKSNQDALDQARAAAESAGDGYDTMDAQLSDAADGAEKSGGIIGKLKGIFGDAEDGGKSFGDVADDLAGKIGIQLPDGAKKAINAVGPMGGIFATIATSAGAAATAITTVETALAGITEERADYATGIANIASTINMSVESTQLWDYVLKTVGSSIEEAQGDLSAFQEKIMEASEGTGEAYEMFEKLGVSVTDQSGKLRDTESVLTDVVHALQNMFDETERNAISSTLLGGTGEKLIPIYENNAEALQFLMDRKKELGILTGDEIETLKDVTEAMVDYTESVDSAKNAIAVEFAPYLEEFYDMAGDGIRDLGDAVADSGVVDLFGSLLSIFSNMIPIASQFFDVLEPFSPVLELTADGLNLIADALGLIGEGIDQLGALPSILNMFLPSGADMLLPSGGSAFNFLGAINTIFSGISSWLGWNASGTDNFPGGVTWVGENGPELLWLPQGSRIDNAQESRMYGGDTFYITINANKIKELNDLIRMANDARRMQRMGG